MNVENVVSFKDDNDVEKTVQDFYNSILNQFHQATACIDQMDQDRAAIAKEQQALKTEIYDHHGWFSHGIIPHTTINYGLVNKLEGEIQAQEQDITNQGKTLVSLYPGLQTLNNVLNGLMLASNTLQSDKGIDVQRYADDLQVIDKALQGVITAMKAAVHEQMDAALIQASSDDDGSSSKDLEKLAEDSMQYGCQEQSALNSVYSDLETALKSLVSDSVAAKENKDTMPWYYKFFKGSEAASDEKNDNIVMHNADAMSKIIQDTLSNIEPELASLTPDFTQLDIVIQEVLKKVLALIKNTKLSPKEKQGKILNLLVLVLGMFSLVQQFGTKDKTENEKRMSEASLAANEMGISATKMQAKEIEDNQKYAATMETIMKVAQIVVGVIMVICAPGVGSAVLMALATALEASGVMDKLSKAIADATGNQVLADILVGVMEVVTTVGGGMLADAMLNVGMKAAEKAIANTTKKIVEEDLKQVVENATKEVLKKLGKEGDKELETAISAQIRKAAETAGKAAAKKIFMQTFKANGLDLTVQYFKEGGIKSFRKAIVDMTKKAMEAAFKDAAENTVEEAAKIVENSGTKIVGMSKNPGVLTGVAKAINSNDPTVLTEEVRTVVQEAQTQLAALSEKIANETVADMTHVTSSDGFSIFGKKFFAKTAEKKIAEDTAEKGIGSVAARRGIYTALYALGTTNILTDLATELQKSNGKKTDDEAFRKLMTGLQILQELIAMFAQIMGSGMASQVAVDESSFTKVANWVQPLPMAANVVANVGKYDALIKQAGAVDYMSKTETMIHIIQSIMDNLAQELKNEQMRDSKQQADFTKTTKQLSESMYIGDYMVPRVISA